METYDVIVVGGGVTGLTTASKLRNANQSVLVLDKAKRLGGRVASGKIGRQLLDVGVPCTVDQLQPVGEPSDSPFALRSHDLFTAASPAFDTLPTAAQFCDLWSQHFTWQQAFVTKVEPHGSLVSVRSDSSGEAFLGHNVIFTCPPAQSAHLLKLSGREAPEPLAEIIHTREILLLVEVDGGIEEQVRPSEILSVHQRTQNNEKEHIALALRTNTEWSEAVWDDDAQNTRATLLHEFAQMFPTAMVLQSETKRWRYANATATVPEPFVEVPGSHGIWCAGDGFGEASLSGLQRAVKSGFAIGQHLSSQ